MREMKEAAQQAENQSITIIGDLIGSRSVADRAAVHRRLETALTQGNEEFDPQVPLRVTVGDEYQGIFKTLGGALQATLRLRLAMLPVVDVRHGIGVGAVAILRESPRIEDGPGWWAAREAIEAVEAAEQRSPTRAARTAVAAPDGSTLVDLDAVNAALLLRDHVVGDLSARSLSVLRALLKGQRQHEIANTLGISASAVSQRVRADGIGILLAADERLARL